jgi:hypothetical protein
MEWNTVKLVKKLLGENEVEAVLQRLDRLTADEARTTSAQTLEVVYGLVQNVKVVIDGEQTHLACLLLAVHIFPYRWESIDRECPGFPWYILLMTEKWFSV